MASKKIETFDPVSIKNTSVQFKGDDKDKSTKFGCVGSIEGETEMKELVKHCEGVEVRKRVKPEKMTLTLEGHVKVDVMRNIVGLENKDLKKGIYRYSTDAKGKEFTLTGDVEDEFEDVTKLIAFPNCISNEGLKFSIENGADEVAEVEMEFDAYPEGKDIYYEAIIDELDDDDKDDIQEKWHSEFDMDLIEEPSA